jgi:hypothetical protein
MKNTDNYMTEEELEEKFNNSNINQKVQDIRQVQLGNVMHGLQRMNSSLGNPFNPGHEIELSKYLVIKGSRGETFIWNETCQSYSFWDSKDDLHPALLAFCPSCYSPSRKLTNQDIKERYVFRATTIRFHMLGLYSRIDPSTKTAVISCLRQTKFQPTYHQDVQDWLTELGGSLSQKLLDWVASFCQVERPTCALYIYGARGVGKNLLAEGLSEIFGLHGKWKEAAGDFQSSMGMSPMVWANEKMEKPKSSQIIDVLRDLIGTGSNYVNEKNRPGYDMEAFYRLIITANNENLLKRLGSHNKEDLAATKERVGFIEVGPGASTILQKLAAKAGCSLSELTLSFKNYKIAEHALWLAQTTKLPNYGNQRFLVEGWESKCTDNFDNESFQARDLGLIMEYVYNKPHVSSIKIQDNKCYLNVTSITKDWDVFGPKSEKAPNWRLLQEYLQNIAVGKVRLRPTGDRKENPVYYWEVPLEKVIAIMDANNFNADSLLPKDPLALFEKESNQEIENNIPGESSEVFNEIMSALESPDALPVQQQYDLIVKLKDHIAKDPDKSLLELMRLRLRVCDTTRPVNPQSTMSVNILKTALEHTSIFQDKQDLEQEIEDYIYRFKSSH